MATVKFGREGCQPVTLHSGKGLHMLPAPCADVSGLGFLPRAVSCHLTLLYWSSNVIKQYRIASHLFFSFRHLHFHLDLEWNFFSEGQSWSLEVRAGAQAHCVSWEHWDVLSNSWVRNEGKSLSPSSFRLLKIVALLEVLMTYLEMQTEAGTMKDSGKEAGEGRKEDRMQPSSDGTECQHSLLLVSEGFLTNPAAEGRGGSS